MSDERSTMTFTEKSTWATLLTTGLIYGVYFGALVAGSPSGPESVGWLAGAVAAQVVAMVVIHIAVAALRRPEREDERDRGIEVRSEYYASLTLTVCVVLTMMAALGAGVVRAGEAWAGVAPLIVFGNVLMASLVASQIVKSLTQVVLYRKAA